MLLKRENLHRLKQDWPITANEEVKFMLEESRIF